MKLSVASALVLSTTLSLFAGCGGKDEGAACGSRQTCGGNIEGHWNVTSSCFSGDAALGGLTCVGAKVDLSGLKATGSISYNADKTSKGSLVVGGTMLFDLPRSCLAAGVSCEVLGARVMDELALDDEGTFTAATCHASDLGCACTFTMRPDVVAGEGTYATSGATLTETNPDGEVNASTYCASGKSLTIHNEQMSMGKVVFAGTFGLTRP